MAKKKPEVLKEMLEDIMNDAKPEKPEKFLRIKLVTTKEDFYESYQPEIIEVVGDKVVARRMVDKPNLFEYAFACAADMIDPRNEERDFETPF